MLTKNPRLIVCGAIIFTFLFTLIERHQWFGILSITGHQWITGTSLKFIESWLIDGALNLKFSLLENPASIEFGSGPQSIAARGIYISYPLGAFLIPYWILLVTHINPSPGFLMAWNLLNQLVVSFFLFELARLIVRPQKNVDWFYAGLPAFCYLLWPRTMYWHQNVYFGDQAVIVWLMALTWWLLPTENSKALNPWKKSLVTFCLAFFLCYTDWIGPVTAFFIFLSPLIVERVSIIEMFRRRWEVILAAAVSAMLYVGQVLVSGRAEFLLQKFLQRTAVSAEGEVSWLAFLFRVVKHVGAYEILFLIFGVFIVLRNWKTPVFRYLIWVLLLPSLLEMAVLRNFTYHHDFSTLKIFPFLFLSFFAFMPVSYLSQNGRTKAVGFFVIVILGFHSQYKHAFPEELDYWKFYSELKRVAQYDQIYLSDQLEIPENPPQAVSLSRKRIYKISNEQDFQNIRNRLLTVAPKTMPQYVLALKKESRCLQKIKEDSEIDRVEMPDDVVLLKFRSELKMWPCEL